MPYTLNSCYPYLMAKLNFSDILELSIPERIQLVQDIWDTITDVPESLELTEDQKQEIDRRIDKLDRHPETAIEWSTLKERIGL